jgi:hypothetical protein
MRNGLVVMIAVLKTLAAPRVRLTVPVSDAKLPGQVLARQLRAALTP